MIVVGDTHAVQGTAMDTSMTTQLKVTLHKKDNLPKKVAKLDPPLLEVSDKFVVHGFAYAFTLLLWDNSVVEL
jgi:acetamidase/formamidase